jgi:hypothetical protein
VGHVFWTVGVTEFAAKEVSLCELIKVIGSRDRNGRKDGCAHDPKKDLTQFRPLGEDSLAQVLEYTHHLPLSRERGYEPSAVILIGPEVGSG